MEKRLELKNTAGSLSASSGGSSATAPNESTLASDGAARFFNATALMCDQLFGILISQPELPEPPSIIQEAVRENRFPHQSGEQGGGATGRPRPVIILTPQH